MSIALETDEAIRGDAEALRLVRGHSSTFPPLRLILALISAVVVGLTVAMYVGRAPAAVETESRSEIAKPAWVEITKPFENYALRAPVFGKEPGTYEARRHRTGGGRRDTLSFGTVQPGPWLRLSVYRIGTEEVADAPFYVDMARRAADAGQSIQKSTQPGDMATRFGVFETADLTLARGDTLANCLGFRINGAEGALRIGGLACGTSAKPLDRLALACMVDKLDLVSSGDDRLVQQFFVDAELNRGETCGGAHALASTAPKLGWLDPKEPPPPLKPGRQEPRSKAARH